MTEQCPWAHQTPTCLSVSWVLSFLDLFCHSDAWALSLLQYLFLFTGGSPPDSLNLSCSYHHISLPSLLAKLLWKSCLHTVSQCLHLSSACSPSPIPISFYLLCNCFWESHQWAPSCPNSVSTRLFLRNICCRWRVRLLFIYYCFTHWF